MVEMIEMKILEITIKDIRKEVKKTINECINHHNSPFVNNIPKTHKFIVNYPEDFIVNKKRKAEITTGYMSFLEEKISDNIINLITRMSRIEKKSRT